MGAINVKWTQIVLPEAQAYIVPDVFVCRNAVMEFVQPVKRVKARMQVLVPLQDLIVNDVIV